VIEDKGLSLAIHYRKARDRREARAKVLAAAARLDGARLLGGKEVLNVLPAGGPHKGRALERARAREACDAAIYVGDDETDEDAFALGRRGSLLAIRVGRKRDSSAAYYIRAQAEIDLLLGRLLALRTSPPPLGEALEFMRLLWAVDHGLQSRSKQMAATLGVTGPQRLVIRILGRSPGLSAGQLAHVLHLHPSTLTGVLRRLERRELVTRRRDPRDARRAVLGLSAAGRRLDVATAGTVESAMTDVLAILPRKRLLAARETLLALARRLNGKALDDPGRTDPSR
jgi:DNA-binding MarR family transcriptional regulator